MTLRHHPTVIAGIGVGQQNPQRFLALRPTTSGPSLLILD
jgi:hypothetical protein